MTDEEEDKMLESMTDDEIERYYEENYSVNPEYIKKGWFIQKQFLGVKPDGSFGYINKVRVTKKGLEELKNLAIKDGLIS